MGKNAAGVQQMTTKKLGTKKPGGGTWVQTERSAHEAWAGLVARKPRAAQLLHVLVSKMGSQNAVVASQKILAALMGVSVDTVQRATKVLEAEKWVQIVKIGKGKEAAYVVNDRVAWGQQRGMKQHISVFSATVVADSDDQEPQTLNGPELRRIPVLYPGDQQLPEGDSDEPPSQGLLEGCEPDLPAIVRDEQGNEWEVNQETGEMQRRIGGGQ